MTVVDDSDAHVYQPALLFLPFGDYTPDVITKPRQDFFPAEAQYLRATIDRVDADDRAVFLTDGRVIRYDVLVIATGSQIAPEETEGMTGPGWREKVFDFYTIDGAMALRDALAKFDGGRLVVSVTEMPIKCPVAPLEFAFLADAYFTKRGIRDRVTITFVTPLDGPFTKPVATDVLSHLLDEKGIHVEVEFNTGRVDGEAGILASWDERHVPFDLLVTIPVHKGADFVGRSPGLGDEMNWVLTDPRTLQATRAPSIFVIGDATNVPASKAGSVAHFESEVLAPNIQRFLDGRPLEPAFDGHANCFIETGHGKALLIDFNYEVEPLPGRFPFMFGPMSLLKETRLNHIGKLAFRWIYWNLLLPGRDLPGISPQLQMAGKQLPRAARPASRETAGV